MSNALYFMFDKESELLNVRRYFLSRKNYQETGKTLVYENEDTEFGFTIDFFARNNEPDDLPEVKGPHIIVNVNYLRPMVYICEIVSELGEFLNHFAPRFYDEVTGGLDSFSLSKFESEWIKANQTGLVNYHEEYGIFVADDRIIQDAWKWNFGRRLNELALGDEYYFAKVMFRKSEDSVSSARTICTWPDLIPLVIPSFVSEVVVIREVLKSRGLVARILGNSSNAENFAQVIALQDIEKLGAFENFEVNGLDCLKLRDKIPDQLKKMFLEIASPLEGVHASVQLVSPEQVVEKSATIARYQLRT